jgi:cytochrome o ubiquinol oxidase subunit III
MTNATELERNETMELKSFGFWIYLMSDLILFSVLFSAFAVVGHNYAGGPSPRELFNIPYLFGETMFLLVSSTTYGLSMVAMYSNRQKLVLVGLIATFFLGLGFLFMELNEFIHLIGSGAVPERSGFLSAFFALVGTHGTHVTFGLVWMAAMTGQIVKKGMTAGVQSRLFRLGLFWHFLDIVWIGVFTFVYLLGVV